MDSVTEMWLQVGLSYVLGKFGWETNARAFEDKDN